MNDAPPPTTTRRTLLAGMALIAGRERIAGARGAEPSHECRAARRLDLRQQGLCRRWARRDQAARRGAAIGRDRHARRARRLDHQRHRGPARRHAEGRDPPRRLGRRQQRAAREGADRGEGALGRRGARQARQDQGRVPQELRRDARRRAGAEAADRRLHHLRGALSGPHHAGDRGGRLERVQRRDLARGVRARSAGDRSQADHQRRRRLRQRHRAFGARRRRRSPRSSPRSSPRQTSSNGAL